MTAKEFLKLNGFSEVKRLADGNGTGEYIITAELLEDYHQAKLKLLSMPDVGQLLKAYNAYLNKQFFGEVLELDDEDIEEFQKSL